MHPGLLAAHLLISTRAAAVILHPFMGPRFKGAVVTTDLPPGRDKERVQHGSI